MNMPSFVPVYPDRLLRLIAIPLLGIMYRHIGEPAPLITLLRNPIYYTDLLVSIIGIWVIWELIKMFIRYLDRYYSWIQDFFQRLVIQLIAVYATTISYTLLLTFIYNDIIMRPYRHDVYNINFSFVIDIPVSLLITTIVQLLYYIMYLQAYFQVQMPVMTSTLPSEKEPPTTARKNILVYFGKSLLPITLEDVAYFHKVGEVTLARTIENQDYRIDQTLEQLQMNLAASTFYRLNRQMIVNMNAIKEVKNDPSGKLFVILQPNYDIDVTVSRKKAADFKNWLNG